MNYQEARYGNCKVPKAAKSRRWAVDITLIIEPYVGRGFKSSAKHMSALHNHVTHWYASQHEAKEEAQRYVADFLQARQPISRVAITAVLRNQKNTDFMKKISLKPWRTLCNISKNA
jgi:hypothetical protein